MNEKEGTGSESSCELYESEGNDEIRYVDFGDEFQVDSGESSSENNFELGKEKECNEFQL